MESELGEFPSLAILHYVNSNGFSTFPCGGTLINKQHILTAAHCVTGAILEKSGKLHKVRLGEHDLSQTVCTNGTCNNGVIEMDIEKIIIHKGYDDRSKIHDIALIRFSKEIDNYETNISPVCLRWIPQSPNPELLPTHNFTAVGWGRTLDAKRSNVSNKLEIPWYHHEDCKQRYSKVRINITDTQICAGGKFKEDTCDGDSGGPLLSNIDGCDYLDGIVSSGKGCGLEDWPGIYTNVTAHKDWIMENLKL
ncbi:unnamed protein product [Hermetia illucens]|uniref:Peptidase S1 domain-containing protein n=2 Tax=Hermetia illucens TaxID=343691 RepID=A0A7R8UBY2_HERIL|nr:unnamed protein product [Hermetia illucens]